MIDSSCSQVTTDAINDDNNSLNWHRLFYSLQRSQRPHRYMHKTLHFQGHTCLNTQARLEGHILKTQEWKPGRGKENKIITGRWRKYQGEQDRDVALINCDSVPSFQLHMRSKRTPESSRVLLYPEGDAWQQLVSTNLVQVSPFLLSDAGRLVVICLISLR